eukprot:TRINITY_DN4690_c0_g1_i1.p2 TRINITY_DN4690_c0_g1~~TRINITY_DN4690_c0_g1_i1.p2  ORF type:complete len:339 (+),score=104.93 TRINITY_DN4690_c0_g1_i1:67-1017(+)
MPRSRYGQLHELIPGRQWRWELNDWSQVKLGKTMDSERGVCFTGEKFYFHLVVSNAGVVGFYVNYKGPPPVPKYSYAIGSTKGQLLRQHTAHSIPSDCSRCGHWNVCTTRDLQTPLQKARDDTFAIWFQFDEDVIRPTGNMSEWVWTIPRFAWLRLGPYYSHALMPTLGPTVCCLKLSVNSRNRSEVVLSISHRQGQPPVSWFRVSNLEGVVLFETPPGQYHDANQADPWPVIPYGLLVDGLGRDGVLAVYVRFGQEALATSAHASTSTLQHAGSYHRPSLPPVAGDQRFQQIDDTQALMMDDDWDNTGYQGSFRR